MAIFLTYNNPKIVYTKNLLVELKHLEICVEVGDQGIQIGGVWKDAILVHNPLQCLSLLEPFPGPTRMRIRWRICTNGSLNFSPGETLLPLDIFTYHQQ